MKVKELIAELQKATEDRSEVFTSLYPWTDKAEIRHIDLTRSDNIVVICGKEK